MLHVLTDSPTILGSFLAELRDVKIQQDRWRFRRNLERTGQIIAYEISRVLPYRELNVQTPLGTAKANVPAPEPVIATVLRAGLPLQHGIMSFFDRADAAYVTAFRTGESEEGVKVELQYAVSPDLTGRTLILADTMLASGTSIVMAYNALVKRTKPASVHIASVIGSREGVEYVLRHIPGAHIWIAAVDEELDINKYIVPGLGDAGDLSFGEKL